MSVPVVFIFAPPTCRPTVALTVPVVSVPTVPLSTSVSKVLGETSASLIVNVPLFPRVAKVIIGATFVSESGVALESVTSPDAPIVVALEIAPTLVIPPV